MMDIRPVTLEGTHVRLVPLSLDQHAALCQVGLDEKLWRLTISVVHTPEDMRRHIQDALDAQARGSALPFAILDRHSGKTVGSSRYANIAREHRRLEIGSTWVARPWQRTVVNTEAKYLRNHMITPSGRIRHSVSFSVIQSEWPEVKAGLEAKIASWPQQQVR